MEATAVTTFSAFEALAAGRLSPDQQKNLAHELLTNDDYFHSFVKVVEVRAATSGGGGSYEQARARLDSQSPGGANAVRKGGRRV